MSGHATTEEVPFEWFRVGGIVYDSVQEACDADHGWRLNEYEVSRHFGGSEEGGWWYDREIPTEESIVLPWGTSFEEAAESCRALNAYAWLQNQIDNPRGRDSVIGGCDLVWHVEQHAPRDRNATRPHYE